MSAFEEHDPKRRNSLGRLAQRVVNAARRIQASAHNAFVREYAVALPAGFDAERARVRLSVPPLPPGQAYSFSEHVSNSDGSASDRVIATGIGGFALSEDLGQSWSRVEVPGLERFPFAQSRALPGGEILFLVNDAERPELKTDANLLVICRSDGTVLQRTSIDGPRWHGPRAIDVSGNTLMYAEYPENDASTKDGSSPHRPSRIWRSRDFGRSWEVVREERHVRHFHFLQARPGKPGEWWLTSGDTDAESRIWKSTDDGDTWTDQTERFGATVEIGPEAYSRRIFRLTDLTWDGDAIIWGSDDVLRHRPRTGQPPARIGSRLFRGNPATGAAPEILGWCGPEVRNLIAVGDHHVVTTQSSHHIENDAPRAYLLSGRSAPSGERLCHLFDVERPAQARTGFTYSRASRRAKDGVFFTFRGARDVFADAPHRILEWRVRFD
jgi:hypothetical protein